MTDPRHAISKCSPCWALAAVPLLLFGCSRGKTHAPAVEAIEVLSPKPGTSVASAVIGVEVVTASWQRISVRVGDLEFEGKAQPRTGTTLFASVQLPTGATEVRVEATDAAGHEHYLVVPFTSLPLTGDSELVATPELVSDLPGEVTLRATPSADLAAIVDFRFDNDGDGVVDITQPTGTLVVGVAEPALLWPRVFAHTDQGVLVPITVRRPVRVYDEGQGTERHDQATDTPVADLAWDAGRNRLAVLSDSLRVIDGDGHTVFVDPSTTPTTCTAIATDADGNIYCVLPGEARIQRRLAASDYALDTTLSLQGTFGLPGSEVAFFNSPHGVSVGDAGLEGRIWVADSGNARVQQFTSRAEFVTAFDGSEEGGQPLGPITTLLVRRDTTLAIVSADGHSIRLHEADGTPLPSDHLPRFERIVDLFETTEGWLGVADAGRDLVVFLGPDGREAQRFASPVPFSACVHRVVGTARQLVLADTETARLVILTLPPALDPAEPLRVVSAFVEAIRNGDLRAAEQVTAPVCRARLAMLDLPQAGNVAAALTGLAVVNQTQHAAIVIARLGAAIDAERTEFVLRRSAHDNAMRIIGF